MERCDNEKELFNARVKEDEMIISINEYNEMKAHLKWQEACINNRSNEFRELKIELEKANEENTKLKNGIINFVKCIGEDYGQTR
jgi:hypothetical protein